LAPQETQRLLATGGVLAKPHDGQMTFFLDGAAMGVLPKVLSFALKVRARETPRFRRTFSLSSRPAGNLALGPLSNGSKALSKNPRTMSQDSSSTAGRIAPDDDLGELPAPRHPFRRLTFATMVGTALFALLLIFALRREVVYSLKTGAPIDLGELTQLTPSAGLSNSWVRGEASLQTDGAVRYKRPLDRDTYRLVRVEGNSRLWVQVRVPFDPSDPEGAHFVPPTSFVGRMIPAERAGLRHSALAAALAESGRGKFAEGAWLLIDGESPASTRWTLGLVVLFVLFALFNVAGVIRLARPAR
jgi:hypothetical protein